MSSMILDFLKFVNEMRRGTRQKSIAVIETGKNKCTDKCFNCVFLEMTNRINSAELKETGATDIAYMLLEGQGLIESYPEITGGMRKSDRRVNECDGGRKRGVILK